MTQKTWSTTLVGTVSLLAAYSLLPSDSAWSSETAAVIPSEQADFANEQAAVQAESPMLSLLSDTAGISTSKEQTPEIPLTTATDSDDLPIAFLPQTSKSSEPIIAEPVEPLEVPTAIESIPQEDATILLEDISDTLGSDKENSLAAVELPISTDLPDQQKSYTEEASDAISESEQQLSLLDLLSSMENSAERKAGARRVLEDLQKPQPEPNLNRYLTNRSEHNTSQESVVSAVQSESSSPAVEATTTPPQQQYVIQPGDTLSKLSQKFNISVEDLVQANDIQNPDLILTENTLVIPIVNTETDTVTAQDGSWQSRQVEAAAPLPSNSIGPIASRYVWPTRGTLTSGYGWRWGRMHRGVDIAAPVGTPVIASSFGTIEFAGWNQGGYGYLVDIRHPDGSLTRYAHNSELLVTTGQQIHQGQVIAKVGSTGYSTGPHLHFEIHQPNQGAVNPMGYLSAASR